MNAKEARKKYNDKIEDKKREAISKMLPAIYAEIEIAIENCLNSVTVELENDEERIKFDTCKEVLKREGYRVYNTSRIAKNYDESYTQEKTEYKISW